MEIKRIPADIEQATRDLLGHAARAEDEEFSEMLRTLPPERIGHAVTLCMFVAGYAAIDVVGREWPNEENLRKIARGTVKGSNAQKQGLTEQDAYDFVARASLRFEPLDKVFPDPERLITVPFQATVHLLVSYHPQGMTWWDWLDRIEEMYEIAANGDLDVTPAFMLRARRTRLDASKPGPG